MPANATSSSSRSSSATSTALTSWKKRWKSANSACFLKLVAQLESYDQIEPLPDIDFNIRAGNTLVGFTSLEEVKRALGADIVKQLAIPNIEERAEIVDRAFYKFREMQTGHGMDAGAFANAKLALRERLDDLRAELDGYLASEFGVRTGDQAAYRRWRDSHLPFHWFVEFHGIMHNGGFDVILGNPPYLETQEVPYSTRFFTTEDSGPVHAMCMERSLALCERDGCVSMIVPLALVSTQRMTALQHMLERDRDCWYSNFAWRPGKLFDTVNRALTIFVTVKPKDDNATFSTSYLKWNSDSRSHLIPSLRYAGCPRNRRTFWAPKLGHHVEISILKKCRAGSYNDGKFHGPDRKIGCFTERQAAFTGKYSLIFAPAFYVNGVAGSSSRETYFTLTDAQHVKAAVAILSSDVFWWWYTITSNLRDLNPSDWKSFPVPESAMNDPRIRELGSKYIADLQANSTMRVRNQRSTGRTETQSFKVQKSKVIIDKIDKVLAMHYSFNDEETDFLVNYDIKFRVGLAEAAPENDR